MKSQFYMPAEWHPHERCWMAFPCRDRLWGEAGLARARQAYVEVALAISQFEPVTLVTRPEDLSFAQSLAGDRLNYLSMPLNDSWMRDTGPTFVINTQGQKAGCQWIHTAWGHKYPDHQEDARLAARILQHLGLSKFKVPLVMEGGAIHVDGEGTLLTTESCLLNANRNPHLSRAQIEAYFARYLGIQQVIWLKSGLMGDDTDGHVDELATFIAPGKVLALVTSNQNDENYELLQQNLAILQSFVEVITIEMPEARFYQSGECAGQRLTLSYINYYLANGGIVMPSFDQPDYDHAAFTVLSQCFPEHQIVQIPALAIFEGGGGIHCITQQEPKQVRPNSRPTALKAATAL